MLQLIPPLFVREHISVFDTGARFSHHTGDGITPFLIMRRFLVQGRVIRSAIDFDQYKACRVILLSNDIKPGNTGLLHAVTSIFECGGAEGLNQVRLNLDKNMDYEHNILLMVSIFKLKFTKQARYRQIIPETVNTGAWMILTIQFCLSAFLV